MKRRTFIQALIGIPVLSVIGKYIPKEAARPSVEEWRRGGNHNHDGINSRWVGIDPSMVDADSPLTDLSWIESTTESYRYKRNIKLPSCKVTPKDRAA